MSIHHAPIGSAPSQTTQGGSDAAAGLPTRSRPRAIVTRPAGQACAWVADLQQLGLDAVALPLIVIGAVDDPAALRACWRTLAQYDAVMFVSGNAVLHFFAQMPAEMANPFVDPNSKLRAWVTGPASQRALQDCGMPSAAIAAPSMADVQFDSEALWRAVRAQVVPGYRVLIVRGTGATARHVADVVSAAKPQASPQATPAPALQGVGRDWFAQQVLAAGGVVDAVVAYQRCAPVWDAAQRDWIAQAACDGSVWLLSSAQAVADLVASLPQQDWAQARAVATHPRIALAARDAGFGWVQEARPVLAEIVASIESRP